LREAFIYIQYAPLPFLPFLFFFFFFFDGRRKKCR